MKSTKGFTIIELCVVLAIISILATVTIMYGQSWVSGYRLSNFLRATEGGIRTARMQAITQGRDCALIISSNDIDLTTKLLTTENFKGNYVTLGPYTMSLANTDDDWKKYFFYTGSPTDPNNYNHDIPDLPPPASVGQKETRVYYFLYNSTLFSLNDLSLSALGTLDRLTSDSFNIKFNSRGFPWIYLGAAPNVYPKAYEGRSLLVKSKAFRISNGLPLVVTPTGKLE